MLVTTINPSPQSIHPFIPPTPQPLLHTQALAGRVVPGFALLALEAYGALLRTKYSGDNGHVAPLEILERELV